MLRRFVLLSLSLCLGAMAPCTSQAQLIPGGGAIPVYDHHNWLRNLITSLQLFLQVANSNQEVAMMIQNLLQALGQPAYPLADFEAGLAGMSEVTGPRMLTARNLDYFHDDLQAMLKQYYPGYSPLGGPVYPEWHRLIAELRLNTVESIQGQTNVIAGVASDVRYDELHKLLYDRNEQVVGNLQALQTGNAIALSMADGVRRTEKSLAGLANLTAVRTAHDLQKDAWAEVMWGRSLRFGELTTPPNYTDPTGGIKYVALLQGGES